MDSDIVNTFNLPYSGNIKYDAHHRRLRAVILDIPFFKGMFMKGCVVHQKCVDGLPEGSVYIGTVSDRLGLSVFCIFEHESFSPVKNGHQIPVQTLKYEEVGE